MKTYKHYLSASIGLVLFVSVIAFSLPQTGHGRAAASERDVVVTNSPARPVPVAVQGTASVTIANNPAVQVNSSAFAPVYVRDVDRPTAQPFLYEVEITLEDGFGGQNAPIPVPAGKLAVIEYVSAWGTTPASQRVQQFAILGHIVPDNVLHPQYLQVTKQDNGFGGVEYNAGQQVRIYTDVGALARVTRTPAVGTVTFRMIFSGYLVDRF